jgi:nucleotide-binding universal stress UspA family protein
MSTAELSIPIEAQKSSGAFRHILVATDFSEPSRRALCEARLVAAENHAQLSIIHILHPDRKYAALENPPELDLERTAAEKRLQALAEESAPEQRLDVTLLKHGPVVEQVKSVIERQAIDLLVIGTRGRGGLPKLALGSVAEELLRVAPCPVMTIGPQADIDIKTAGVHDAPGFHTILLATDFGKRSAKALPLALALAKARQGKLILLHMISPMPTTSTSLSAYSPASAAADEVQQWESASRKQAVQQLKACLPADHGLEQEPACIVGTEFLAEGVLTASVKYKVDLIVMGANQSSSARVAAHLPWTSVHEVIRYAPCPVLTVGG